MEKISRNTYLLKLRTICTNKRIENPTFIMDNARIHHYTGLKDMVEAYSPFLNPIENVFVFIFLIYSWVKPYNNNIFIFPFKFLKAFYLSQYSNTMLMYLDLNLSVFIKTRFMLILKKNYKKNSFLLTDCRWKYERVALKRKWLINFRFTYIEILSDNQHLDIFCF